MPNYSRKKLIIAVVLVAGALAAVFGMGRAALLAETFDNGDPLKAIQEQQSDLQRKLKKIEGEIAAYQSELKDVRGRKNTLQNRLSILRNERAELELSIRAGNLQAEYLALDINAAEIKIKDIETAIAQIKDRMGVFIKLIYQNDQASLLNSLLNRNNISEVLAESDNYAKITDGLNLVLSDHRRFARELNDYREEMADREEELRNLLAVQKLKSTAAAASAEEQSVLLAATRNQESIYQAGLSSSQKEAQAIRNRLYELLDVENQINFGQAVKIAEWAGSQTGVRPAFILAVLAQESNLGKNVGTCNRKGDPPSKGWKVIMHPTRDQPHFLTITKELGRDPDITPLSCPMRNKDGSQLGWGGAMGPAQFIPSTWMGYRGKVTAITGKSADPWDIRDAFLAAAIKLGADGAKTEAGEWAAAMRYFSGSTNVKYRFYGDSVVKRAEQFQVDIRKMEEE